MTQQQHNALNYFLACFAHHRACSSAATRTFCRDQMLAARDEFERLGGTWAQLVYEVEAQYGTAIVKDWQE